MTSRANCNINLFSLYHLDRPHIPAFLEYMEQCHPGLKKMLRNISRTLPRILKYGLPPGDLQISNTPLEELISFDEESFNRLFFWPAAAMDTELTDRITDIPPWPLQPSDDHGAPSLTQESSPEPEEEPVTPTTSCSLEADLQRNALIDDEELRRYSTFDSLKLDVHWD